MSRWAQACSMMSLPASLSTPRMRNGPIWLRGKDASFRTIGSVDDAMRKLPGYLPYCNAPALRVAREIGFPFSDPADIVAAG